MLFGLSDDLCAWDCIQQEPGGTSPEHNFIMVLILHMSLNFEEYSSLIQGVPYRREFTMFTLPSPRQLEGCLQPHDSLS